MINIVLCVSGFIGRYGTQNRQKPRARLRQSTLLMDNGLSRSGGLR